MGLSYLYETCYFKEGEIRIVAALIDQPHSHKDVKVTSSKLTYKINDRKVYENNEYIAIEVTEYLADEYAWNIKWMLLSDFKKERDYV